MLREVKDTGEIGRLGALRLAPDFWQTCFMAPHKTCVLATQKTCAHGRRRGSWKPILQCGRSISRSRCLLVKFVAILAQAPFDIKMFS